MSTIFSRALFIILSTFLPSLLWAQERVDFHPALKTIVAEQYQPIDIVFKVKELTIPNPQDLAFTALSSDSIGNITVINGFYNGQSEFVLRFSSEHTGFFKLQTNTTLKKLNALKFTIKVEKSHNPNLHGSVRISPESSQKFIYQDGRPYFALAFELDWLFALDMNNRKGIPKTTEIIQAVKENGFNQVVMNVYAYDVGWKVDSTAPAKYDFKKPNYTIFGGDNENPDFSQLNISFFQQLDRVIQHLNEQGIVAHLMIYVWNKKVKWPEMYSDADNRYFDYIIKRYQAYPNIIWDVSKEALDYGRCDIPYINERIERIRKLDSYKHLVTVHDYEYCSREPDKIDFISIQNWRTDLYSLSLEAVQKYPNKPVMNIEHGGYEEGPYSSFTGNYTDPITCLERQYACVFAGIYSCYYWQNSSWNIVIYDIMNASQYLRKPRFDYYKHLQSLFSTYDFSKLIPYKQKLTINSRLGNDNLASSGYALTDNRDLYLYYVPGINYQINIVIPKPASGRLKASWFNIFTGETREEINTDWYLFKAYQCPWKGQSAVLIINGK